MKKLLIVLVGIGVIYVGGCLMSGLVNWLVADMGRYFLGLIILGYIVYRLGKEEFDK